VREWSGIFTVANLGQRLVPASGRNFPPGRFGGEGGKTKKVKGRGRAEMPGGGPKKENSKQRATWNSLRLGKLVTPKCHAKSSTKHGRRRYRRSRVHWGKVFRPKRGWKKKGGGVGVAAFWGRVVKTKTRGAERLVKTSFALVRRQE